MEYLQCRMVNEGFLPELHDYLSKQFQSTRTNKTTRNHDIGFLENIINSSDNYYIKNSAQSALKRLKKRCV